MNKKGKGRSLQEWLGPLLLAGSLGLAPFAPEPHLFKQIKSIIEGTFTQPMDWFDLALHGGPWVWLVWVVFKQFKTIQRNKK